MENGTEMTACTEPKFFHWAVIFDLYGSFHTETVWFLLTLASIADNGTHFACMRLKTFPWLPLTICSTYALSGSMVISNTIVVQHVYR